MAGIGEIKDHQQWRQSLFYDIFDLDFYKISDDILSLAGGIYEKLRERD